MSKGLIAATTILTVGLICGVLYTKIPVKVDKNYKVFVYSEERQPIKEVSVKLRGGKYNGLISRDYFTGTIEVEGETTQISSTKDRKARFLGLDLKRYYHASNPNPNSINKNQKGIVVLKTSIVVSKDFKTIYGCTPKLKEKYGNHSYFKSDKNIKTSFDEGLSSLEQRKRIDLYLTAMKDAFQIENNNNLGTVQDYFKYQTLNKFMNYPHLYYSTHFNVIL